MAWMNMLYKTYENNAGMVGKVDSEKVILAPISHEKRNCQLEITITENGDFVSARPLEKAEGETLIPVSEKSGSRTSSFVPHPLCDYLSCIAQDFSTFSKEQKVAASSEQKYLDYIAILRNWVESEYKHSKVNALYNYVKKGKVISDLISQGLIQVDENGKMIDGKISKTPYDKVMIRLIVLSNENTDINPKAWEDKTLWDSYINFYRANSDSKKDYCYVEGKVLSVCENHPKGVVSSDYGAKLISANDTVNYTFKGRFQNSQQALAISYDASQKAHAALTWLSANQGVFIGQTDRRVIITWNPKGKEVPKFNGIMGDVVENKSTSNNYDQYAINLSSLIAGYKSKFEPNDEVVVISLDAATQGRLSVTYYNELIASDYLDRIETWYKSCNWYYPHYDNEKKRSLVVETPKTFRIAEYVFGIENSKKFFELNDKVKKEQTQRILHCILDKQPIPRDMVHSIAQKASNPQAYQSQNNYEKVLSTACALTAKFYNERSNNEGVKFSMSLNTQQTDRSYVFGRLLAIAEVAETKAMQTKFAKTGKSTDRETNAQRYMNAFANHPMYVYKTIHANLQPYMNMLTDKSRNLFEGLLCEVFDLIDEENPNINKPLDERYLIGYYNQKQELLKKDDKNKNETLEEE